MAGRLPQPRLRRTGGPTSRPGCSDHPMQPAGGVVGAAVLDVDERLADLHREGSRLGGALDLAAGPLQRADRRHDGGGAAGEDLGDLAGGDALAPLVDGEPALLDLVTGLPGDL